ncbi:hypothetical protein [Luteibacter yeojuensis]|uniref:J domain-containing protein n=1 Tax=Luteibacter yeojuensis TaxID=345309 RepID=A0A7X5TQ24_9GAMM|nr:hypothetical protein [Luteibacter yeojuensis]NID16066.1 hypothetical protein [Luteibacter yeojuensis]
MHWHLEVLGLPAHADLVAVRRAYATALRGIDPATDPAGFAHLRNAYEAARAWCEQATAPADFPLPEKETPDTESASPPPEETPPPYIDPTVTLAWRFAADVGARRVEAVPQLLEEALAELRTQYIDAPGRFEEYLIDLLGLQRIGHRAAVFAAAEEQFHWREVGHLSSLGQRGQWIELVLAQREDWLALPEDRRRAWIEMFAQAEFGLDSSMARRWPEISRLSERFPAWLSLHVSADTLQAWKAAFDAQPPSMQETYRRMAPPASVYWPKRVDNVRQRSRDRRTMWTVAGFFLFLLGSSAHYLLNAERIAPNLVSSPERLSVPHESAEQCAALYVRMDRIDAFAGLDEQEIATLKSRGDNCARDGLWHPPKR